MDSPLTMNRVIHAAVRRDLKRMEGGLRDLRDGDGERAAAIGRTWDNLRTQLTHHHEGEDELVFPFLASVGVDATLLGEMDSEHQELARALGEGGIAIDAVRGTASSEAAAKAADVLAEAYAVVDRHLNHEENEVEPLLAQHVESAGWKAVEKQLRSRDGLVGAGWFIAWIQDGASADELNYLRSNIPGPILFIFGRIIGRGYHGSVASAWN